MTRRATSAGPSIVVFADVVTFAVLGRSVLGIQNDGRACHRGGPHCLLIVHLYTTAAAAAAAAALGAAVQRLTRPPMFSSTASRRSCGSRGGVLETTQRCGSSETTLVYPRSVYTSTMRLLSPRLITSKTFHFSYHGDAAPGPARRRGGGVEGEDG